MIPVLFNYMFIFEVLTAFFSPHSESIIWCIGSIQKLLWRHHDFKMLRLSNSLFVIPFRAAWIVIQPCFSPAVCFWLNVDFVKVGVFSRLLKMYICFFSWLACSFVFLILNSGLEKWEAERHRLKSNVHTDSDRQCKFVIKFIETLFSFIFAGMFSMCMQGFSLGTPAGCLMDGWMFGLLVSL